MSIKLEDKLFMEFDSVRYKLFKKAYINACNENLESFIFDEQDFMTSYAKYVLEYLKPRFER